jgi:hypothetical protein
VLSRGRMVFKVLLYSELVETGWCGLGNRIVQFGCCYELAPASAQTFAFSPWALFCSAATSSRPFSVLCFGHHWPMSDSSALSDLGCPPDPSAEDPSLGNHCLRYGPVVVATFGETRWSSLTFWIVQFSYLGPLMSCWWPTLP